MIHYSILIQNYSNVLSISSISSKPWDIMCWSISCSILITIWSINGCKWGFCELSDSKALIIPCNLARYASVDSLEECNLENTLRIAFPNGCFTPKDNFDDCFFSYATVLFLSFLLSIFFFASFLSYWYPFPDHEATHSASEHFLPWTYASFPLVITHRRYYPSFGDVTE